MSTPIDSDIKATMDRVLANVKAKAATRTPEELAERESQRTRSRLQEAAARMHVPKRQWEVTPKEDGEWGVSMGRVRRAIGRGATIVLCGARGNGKTQITVELLKDAARQDRDALYTDAMGFFMALKACYGDEAEFTETEVIEKFRGPALLVIDEVGRRGQTEWENNVLFHLLNKRYEDMTDTVMTCNMSVAEVSGSLGPSLVSRINEGGGIIECNWESFRK